jgi:hypothetical protein
MERHCTKQVRFLEDRLAELRSREHSLAETTKRLREEAKLLPPGLSRWHLLRKARQAETASHIRDWLSSPELKAPS